MATKTAKTRNPDRKSGKAWSKSHNATVKVLSPEAQERKAQKDAERERRRSVSPGGSNITLPRMTWEWTGEMMQGRHTRTRRMRTFEAWLERERGGS